MTSDDLSLMSVRFNDPCCTPWPHCIHVAPSSVLICSRMPSSLHQQLWFAITDVLNYLYETIMLCFLLWQDLFSYRRWVLILSILSTIVHVSPLALFWSHWSFCNVKSTLVASCIYSASLYLLLFSYLLPLNLCLQQLRLCCTYQSSAVLYMLYSLCMLMI